MYKSTFLLLFIIWTSHIIMAQDVPDKISYQGILYENDTAVNAIKDFTFKIGNWEETHLDVQVTKGRYVLQLGSINPLSVSDFEGQAVATLEIEVDENLLSPMVDLLTVPYAFYAQKAEDANHLNGEPASHYEMPVGTIVAFGGLNVPSGWLLCDGSEVSRTDTTAALFAALGVAWGAGDFANTFHLPDLRGRFIRGVDGMADRVTDDSTRTSDFVGGNVGDAIGTYQEDEFASHNHEQFDHERSRSNISGNPTTGSNNVIWTDNWENPVSAYDMFLSKGGAESRPINANVHYLIKY